MNAYTRTALLTTLALVTALLGACNSTATRKTTAVDRPTVSRDTPSVLSNTVGAFGQINGLQPIYVSGYGLVVGLNGTGSGDAPVSVRAVLMDEMTKNGVGTPGLPLADVTPSQLIDDPNTAVVLVQALIPPASPSGMKFDVRVNSLPGSTTSSLEGGTLYTTELRRGAPIPSGPETFTIAEARGAILINPLSAPPATGEAALTDSEIRTAGRVLSGGTVRSPFRPTFRLDNPSHGRARSIVQALNARFPQRGSRVPTARGINEDTVEINVPPQFVDHAEDFFSLVLHTRVDQSFTEEYARRYTDAIEQQPALAGRVGWALEALGESAIPFLRRLYDSPERGPRLESLRVGANLGDPLTREHLEKLSLSGPPNQRADAIRLLGKLPLDRRIDVFLGKLLSDEDIAIRVAAFEALEQRGDTRFARGVYRDKFKLVAVPSEKPMIYFTQQGEPKIVLFGDVEISDNAFASGWDDRLMVDTTGDFGASDNARVFYQDYATGRTATHVLTRSAVELIDYFAHRTTPEQQRPGLDLTYSETVGALHQLTAAGAINADFVAESDKLQLDFLRAAQAADAVDRPELSEDGPIDSFADLGDNVEVLTTLSGDRERRDREDDQEWQRRRSRYVVPGPAAQNQQTPPQ